jgi:uncharacterized membrane protein YeaQ/YmgE (transglycosylase-associated protein family)
MRLGEEVGPAGAADQHRGAYEHHLDHPDRFRRGAAGMPGRDPGGFFITAGIGILGSIIATYGGKALGLYSGEETAGFIRAFVGAIILLVLYRVLMRGRST